MTLNPHLISSEASHMFVKMKQNYVRINEALNNLFVNHSCEMLSVLI